MTRIALVLVLMTHGCTLLGGGGDDGCAGAEPSFSGQLVTDVGNVSFDTIEVVIHHNDAGDDAGCVTRASFRLWVGSEYDCALQVDAGGALDGDGRLEITSLGLSGLGCPDYPAQLDGVYQAQDLSASGVVFGGGVSSPEHTVDACFESTFDLELGGVLEKTSLGDGADTIDLTGTSLRVEGPMPSIGETVACPL